MSYAPGPWILDGPHVIGPGEFHAYIQGLRFDCKSNHRDTARLIHAAPKMVAALRTAECVLARLTDGYGVTAALQDSGTL